MIEHNHPVIGDAEAAAVERVLRSGRLAQGTEVAALEAEFAAVVGTPYAVAVANGTVAIEVGLQTLGIGPGDEVVVPSFSFIATANAVRRVGAKPVFADIDPKTYCVSAATVEPMLTPRTKAVMAVHLYGHPVEMDPLVALCEDRDLHLLEDSAQGIGASWRGSSVGSFGRFATFSLYATKNVTSGEGGMITTSDAKIAEMARSLRSHNGVVVDGRLQVASNSRMTDIQAAIGRVQLSRLEEFQTARHRLAAGYEAGLGNSVATPYTASDATHAYHLYTVRTANRDALTARLDAAGIGYGIYYATPIHMTETYLGESHELADTETAAREVISLPIRPDLTQGEQKLVIDTVNGGD